MKTIQILKVVSVVLATLVHAVGTENDEELFVVKRGWPYYYPMDVSVSII